jgi:hypothetical protein
MSLFGDHFTNVKLKAALEETKNFQSRTAFLMTNKIQTFLANIKVSRATSFFRTFQKFGRKDLRKLCIDKNERIYIPNLKLDRRKSGEKY